MNELLKKIRLKDASAFTHSGKFHADDVFSSALLLYLNPEITILRGNKVPEDFDGIIFDIGRGIGVQDKLNIMTTSMENSGVMMIVLIYLMAGGFQGAAAAMGGKDSVVNLCLHFIPVKLLVPGVFLMCCFISTSIGTSMGTIAAMAPIAINVAQGAHLNVAVVGAAVIGGSYFGDNLSMISDTTISAAEGCGSEMKDKFKMNFFIALPAAIVAMILYSIFGGVGSGAIEAGSYSIIEVLPYFIVLMHRI